MRVVLLVTDLGLGGTPMRLARLARGLVDAGVEVVVGCLAARGPVSALLERDGIETFDCGARSAWNMSALSRLTRHIRRINPDIMHATLTHANVAARFIGWRLGVPVLTSTATIEVERPMHRRLERWTARRDRGHIVNNAALAEHVAWAFRVPRERIFVVPPMIGPPPACVDRAAAREQLGLPPNVFVVVWTGRFDPVKRLDLLVHIAEQPPATAMHFAIAGDGPARGEVEALTRHSPARERIHLLGWQADLGPVLSAADAFVLPSLTEGVPNALLEAMAFGLPAVAADLPTLRTIPDVENRVMLVGDDEAAAYAATLHRLSTDAVTRDALATNGQAWARSLTVANGTAAIIEVYRRVLGE